MPSPSDGSLEVWLLGRGGWSAATALALLRPKVAALSVFRVVSLRLPNGTRLPPETRVSFICFRNFSFWLVAAAGLGAGAGWDAAAPASALSSVDTLSS